MVRITINFPLDRWGGGVNRVSGVSPQGDLPSRPQVLASGGGVPEGRGGAQRLTRPTEGQKLRLAPPWRPSLWRGAPGMLALGSVASHDSPARSQGHVRAHWAPALLSSGSKTSGPAPSSWRTSQTPPSHGRVTHACARGGWADPRLQERPPPSGRCLGWASHPAFGVAEDCWDIRDGVGPRQGGSGRWRTVFRQGAACAKAPR